MAEEQREQELDVGRVQKVRVYDNTVTVERTAPNMKSEEFVTSGPWKDQPRPQFKRAMATLIPIALKLAEISDNAGVPLKSWLSTALVSQVSISKDKRGRRQFSLVVVRSMEHGAIMFNTPIRTEKSDASDVGAQYASAELVKACDRVCQEALLYVNGERTQLVLDLDAKRAEKDGDGDDDEKTEGEKTEAGKPEGLKAAAKKGTPRVRRR